MMKDSELRVEFNVEEKKEAERWVEYAKYTIGNQAAYELEMKSSLETSSFEGTFSVRMKGGDLFYTEEGFKKLLREMKEGTKRIVKNLSHEKVDCADDSRTRVMHYTYVFSEEEKARRKTIHEEILALLIGYVMDRARNLNTKLIVNGILYQIDYFDILLPHMASMFSRTITPSTFVLPKGVGEAFRHHFSNSRVISKVNVVKNPTSFDKYTMSFELDVVVYLSYRCIVEEWEKARFKENDAHCESFGKFLYAMAPKIMDFTYSCKYSLDSTHGAKLRAICDHIEAVSSIEITKGGELKFVIDHAKVPKKRLLPVSN
jgi:hypothetical protein